MVIHINPSPKIGGDTLIKNTPENRNFHQVLPLNIDKVSNMNLKLSRVLLITLRQLLDTYMRPFQIKNGVNL